MHELCSAFSAGNLDAVDHGRDIWPVAHAAFHYRYMAWARDPTLPLRLVYSPFVTLMLGSSWEKCT